MKVKKEHIAFWLILAGAPLAASGENLGITIVIILGALILMTDNFKEAINKQKK